MEDTPLTIVEDAAGLSAVLERLRTHKVIGIDTEADSMHHYREKVCLVQISSPDEDIILDPLAGFDMAPLGDLLADPGIVKVFHGADYDVVSLKRDYGYEIRNLFDTMVSAQFLGLPRVGLADLVAEYFGVEMDKRLQTHDWSSRPLEAEHLDYARGDTHFLIALRELFHRRLHNMGRLEAALEEFANLEGRSWKARTGEAPEPWLRIKGGNRLDEKAQRVLRALADFRDEQARQLDRPSYKVIPDPILLKLAEDRPSSVDELHSQHRSTSPMVRRFGEGMLKAIAAGLADERPLTAAVKKERTGTPPRFGARESERLMERLKTWRTEVMKAKNLPMIMVASNNHLKAIAGFRPKTLDELRSIEELRSWQVKAWGDALLAEVETFEASLSPKPEPGTGKRRRRKKKKSSEAAD